VPDPVAEHDRSLGVISLKEMFMGPRVLIVAGFWFAFWMILAAAIGGWIAEPASRTDGIYFGFFNGAWWALLTSFAWPWLMPSAIDRWMYRSEVG